MEKAKRQGQKQLKARKLLAISFSSLVIISNSLSVQATSLESLIANDVQMQTETQEQAVEMEAVERQAVESIPVTESIPGNYFEELKGATDLSQSDPVVSNVNNAIKKVVSIITQILAYAVTALLSLKVVIDLVYITIPFSRKLLASDIQAGMGAQQGGLFNNPLGNLGNQGNQGNLQNQNNIQNNAMFNRPQAKNEIQWVSNAAINAVNQEKVQNVSAVKIYTKDMLVLLVLVPVLLILTITGALADFGFLIGELMAKSLGSISEMI